MSGISPHHVLSELARHIGEENGIGVRALARAVVGPDADTHAERQVREAIVALRRDGHHVCAHPSSGYYIAATEEELVRTCQYLYSRAMCSLEQVAAMRRESLPDLRGQLRLPTLSQRTEVNAMTQNIPEGYMQNAAGHLVPEAQVREADKMRDSVARELAAEAEDIHERLKAFKQKALGDIADLVRMAGERYDVQLGGEKGNVTVASYDGQYKVVRSYAERISFTEELESAKALVDDCIRRWSEGANDNIRALVDRAFRTDNKGQIKTTAILELLRLDIEDEEWERAMEALRESIQVTGTAVYVRVYKRLDGSDQYRPVALDLAGV